MELCCQLSCRRLEPHHWDDELGIVKKMANLFLILPIMVLGAIVVASSELRCRSNGSFCVSPYLGAQIRRRKIIAFWAILFASIGFWTILIVWVGIVTWVLQSVIG